MLYEAGEFEQLARLRLDPFFAEWSSYSHQEFLLATQAVSFFRKYSGFKTGVDLEGVALDKWRQAELVCAKTNATFRDRWSGKQAFPPDVEHVISTARRKITRILGEVTSSDLVFLKNACHFGPGADTDGRARNSSRFHKFSQPGSVTPACADFLDDLFGSQFEGADLSAPRPELTEQDPSKLCDLWNDAQRVATSRLAFVPKTALTDRPICIEPRWNIFVQLGIGELMSKRLRRYGVDIRDQTRNQRLAELAVSHGLATIDLSSASDSVSTNLVIDLLADADPFWLDALLKTRCTHTAVKARGGSLQSYRLEKVSSMGNGYTFPLETLIFFSLAWAASEVLGLDNCRIRDSVSSYGDDIIVPQEVATLLVETLSACGFSVNTEKSYVAGVFFESCGKDYYYGKDARPIFLTEAVDTVPQAFVLCNQLAVLANRLIGVPGFAYGKVWALRNLVIRRIPSHLRCFGPPEAGDGVIHTSFDRALPSLNRSPKRGYGGFLVKCLQPLPVPVLDRNGRPLLFQKEKDFLPHLYSKLSGICGTGNRVFLRDSVSYGLSDVYVLSYTDVLPI